jgi:hypothetical protein
MNWLDSSPAILLLVTAGLTAGACAGEVSLEGKPCPCESGWVCCSDGFCARDPRSCSSTAGAPGEGGSGDSSAEGGSGDSSAEGGSSGDSFSGGDGGTGAASPECPGSVDFETNSAESLALGPHNRVFLAPSIAPDPVQNYDDQVVFPGPTLSLLAKFPEASSDAPEDPSAGAALEPWLGELSLLPEGCEPGSLTGKTVRVRLLWNLDGAIVGAPPHGVFLGSYVDGEPVYYPDASQVQLGHERTGMATGTRALNTLNPIVLTHTFTEDEDSAYLRVYLLEDFEIETTVYVESVTWGEGDLGGAGEEPTGGSGGIGGAGMGGHATGGFTFGGSSDTGGTTGGGGDSGVVECTRPQAEACPETCDAPSAACLQNEDEQVPEQSVHLSGTVSAVAQEPWAWPYDCLGMRGPFGGAQTERVRVDLLDDQGKTWTLSFLPELIEEERFRADDELQIDFERMQANVFNVSRKLSVTRDGEPDAFFIDATGAKVFQSDGEGLAFTTGDLSCAYSVPGFDGCTTARHTVIATSSGTEETTDPCRASLDGFTVSARFQYAGSAPASCNASAGSCDAQSSFVASGVRER